MLATRPFVRIFQIQSFTEKEQPGGPVPKIQEPQYTVKVKDGPCEVRAYGPRIVAETTVLGDWNEAGNEGFRRLAGYIFGGNEGRAKIAMTAPVAQSVEPVLPQESAKIRMTAPVAVRSEQSNESSAQRVWTVSFTMPDDESLASLPVPKDKRVVLRTLPPVDVAVVRFSGRWTDANMKEHEQQLKQWVTRQQLQTIGEPEVNRYDPPFKLWFLRRNEIWLRLIDK